MALLAWGGQGPVAMRWEYGAYPLPITVRVGATLPLSLTSAGRVYLAHLPDPITAPLIQAERLANPSAPGDEDLERFKSDVRRDGVSITANAMIPGATAVAAPVFTTEASLPLVVVIVLPQSHSTPRNVAMARDELLATASAISAALGHSPDTR